MTISIPEGIVIGADVPSFDAIISKTDAALYVERMCAELAGMSESAGLGFLSYLLEVAREEAVLHCPPKQPKVMHGELPPR